jgi:putative restriction endonuclease
MPDEQQSLLNQIARLKTDRARGFPAPHKPLLLLAVMDLIESGRLTSRVIPLTAELTYQFLTYWRIVAYRRKTAPDIRLPFHHLSGDRIWEPLDAQQDHSVDRKLTRFARFSEAVFSLFLDPIFRRQARLTLITNYFMPNEQIALAETNGIPQEELGGGSLVAREEQDNAVQCGREVKFRMVVVSAYSFTCCLTRHRLTTISRGSMVDAAHIHQFADSRNNDPQNGIALSKNAHWMFDQGLWSITEDYTIKVAQSQLDEACPYGKLLAEFEGEKILLPKVSNLWPDPAHLAWHRKKKFLGNL